MRANPRRSISRERRNWTCSSGKSSPTTATSETSVKKLAAVEKYVAEPPSTFSPRPKGVSTISNATVPTTTMPMRLSPRLKVFSDYQIEFLARPLGDLRLFGDYGELHGRCTGTAALATYSSNGMAYDVLG